MNASTSQEAGEKSSKKRATSMKRLKNIGNIVVWENMVRHKMRKSINDKMYKAICL